MSKWANREIMYLLVLELHSPASSHLLIVFEERLHQQILRLGLAFHRHDIVTVNLRAHANLHVVSQVERSVLVAHARQVLASRSEWIRLVERDLALGILVS